MRVDLLSSVGGGPIERLAKALHEKGIDSRMVSGVSAESWRRSSSAGRWGHLSVRLQGMIIFPIRAILQLAARRPDVAIVTTNPFFLPLLIVATKWLHRSRVVALIYDLYPDALEGAGLATKHGWLSRTTQSANRRLFAKADSVVFIGRVMGAHARSRYGEPRSWSVFETGADAKQFETGSRQAARDESFAKWRSGAVLFGYIGNMGNLHDWETLGLGLQRLDQVANLKARFLIAASGPGAVALRKMCPGMDEMVRFEEPLDDAAWAIALREIDVAIVTLRDEARSASVPSKMFSAMAAGSAILAVAPKGSDVASLVMTTSSGVVIEPGDDEGFARTVRLFCEDGNMLEGLRANAGRASKSLFEITVLADRWIEMLHSILSNVTVNSNS